MKKIISLILVVITCFSVTACAPTTPPEKPTYAGDKSMPILSYLPPTPSEFKIQEYIEAGFNVWLFSPGNKSYIGTERFYEELERYRSNGLDVYLRTGDQSYFGKEEKYLDGVEEDFNQYDFVKAMYFWDEPDGAMIEEISNKLVDWWNETYAESKIFFTNLYPSYAPEQALGIDREEYVDNSAWLGYVHKHINEVLKRVSGRKVLSCDHYPLGHNKTLGKDTLSFSWLSDYATIATLAKDIENCDLNLYIQSYCKEANAGKILDCVGDIALQVYTCLALGADSLDFYNYRGAPGEYAIEYNGVKTPVYDYVKQTLNHFRAWENVYLNFEWQGIKGYYGKESEEYDNTFVGISNLSLDSLPGIKSVSSRLNTLAGHFTDAQNRNGYMFVNFIVPSENKINIVDLTFESKYTKALVYLEGEEYEKDIVDGKIRLTLNSGQGAFVIPY